MTARGPDDPERYLRIQTSASTRCLTISTKARAPGAGRHSSSPERTSRILLNVDSRTVSEKSARRRAEDEDRSSADGSIGEV